MDGEKDAEGGLQNLKTETAMKKILILARHRHVYRFGTPRAIDRDNTSVPGQGVDKDDTLPKFR